MPFQMPEISITSPVTEVHFLLIFCVLRPTTHNFIFEALRTLLFTFRTLWEGVKVLPMSLGCHFHGCTLSAYYTQFYCFHILWSLVVLPGSDRRCNGSSSVKYFLSSSATLLVLSLWCALCAHCCLFMIRLSVTLLHLFSTLVFSL